MKKLIPLIAAFFCTCALTQMTFGQDRPADNKALLIKATQILEQQPFHEKAKDFRTWAMQYVIETDDFSVVICSGLLVPVMDKKNKYGSDLLAQYTMGMAAFKLSNPEKINDDNSAQLAGLSSMLKAYEAMIKEKPKAQFVGMDELIKRRDSGDLMKMVEDAKCKEGKSEPIK